MAETATPVSDMARYRARLAGDAAAQRAAADVSDLDDPNARAIRIDKARSAARQAALDAEAVREAEAARARANKPAKPSPNIILRRDAVVAPDDAEFQRGLSDLLEHGERVRREREEAEAQAERERQAVEVATVDATLDSRPPRKRGRRRIVLPTYQREVVERRLAAGHSTKAIAAAFRLVDGDFPCSSTLDAMLQDGRLTPQAHLTHALAPPDSPLTDATRHFVPVADPARHKNWLEIAAQK